MKHLRRILFYLTANVVMARAKIRRNAVLFFLTTTHTDNCLALLEYMVCDDTSEQSLCLLVDGIQYSEYRERYRNQKNVKVVSYRANPFSAIYELTTSKYVFFMHRKPFTTIRKRKGQIAVNLWHGSGYKDAGANDQTWRDGQDFDYVLVPGAVFVETKSKFFSCRRERVLPLGYPRYDTMKNCSSEAEAFVERLLFAADARKAVIWMPTYRKPDRESLIGSESEISYEYDIPLLSSEEELSCLNTCCQKNHMLLIIKRHPYQVKYSCEDRQYSNIVFLSNQDFDENGIQMYECLSQTDALISDYSSVAIDYMLLDKPMAFALDDFEQYKNTRGFVFENPLDYMPGHHLYSFDDMLTFLQDVADGKDPYRSDRQRLMPEVHNPCDNYCERIWKTVRELADAANADTEDGQQDRNEA